jgi:hypothetical protein
MTKTDKNATSDVVDPFKRYAPVVVEGVPFDARVWRVAPPMSGQIKTHGSFDWNIRLNDTETLLDPKHDSLLYHLRLWVWTQLHDPRSSKATSPGGLAALRVCMEAGARWMAAEGMQDFTRLDGAASWRFLDYFLGNHETSRLGPTHRSPKITNASANCRLRFPMLIHRQRHALARFDVVVPAEAPFDGRRIDALVKEDLDLHRQGKLEPIPDCVALELLNRAQRWLGIPADEVLALQEACYERDGPSRDPGDHSIKFGAYAKSQKVAENFRFSILDGEKEPWTSLVSPYERALRDGRTGSISGRQMIRRLILSVQAAAIVAIQACTGIRSSELASFEDVNDGGELPSCITVRPSSDGMLELFYCLGVELKTNKKRDEWLVGARLAGSDYLPLPVRAFSVLHQLFARWRALGDSRQLVLTFSAAKGLPRTASSIGAPRSQSMTNAQKDFLHEHCDTASLPIDAIERFCVNDKLRGHLWRTTFATFLYRIDPRLLEPISRHFKHLRVAMTEISYIGNDVQLLDAMDSSHVQQSARMFHEAIEGGVPIVGGLSESLKNFPRLPGRTLADYELAVVEHDLRLLDFEYGMCGAALNPEKSRCNTLGGTARWSKTSPNEAMRSPSICMGCRLFVASTRHLPYWKQRVELLEQLLREQHGMEHGFSLVTKQRLAAARVMVQRLGGRGEMVS